MPQVLHARLHRRRHSWLCAAQTTANEEITSRRGGLDMRHEDERTLHRRAAMERHAQQIAHLDEPARRGLARLQPDRGQHVCQRRAHDRAPRQLRHGRALSHGLQRRCVQLRVRARRQRLRGGVVS
jgi:hypothetical protein